MFKTSKKFEELLSHYSYMAQNGYQRSDGSFVKKVYSDAEPKKFATQIKKIVSHFKASDALDYGSGGSDLNSIKLENGQSFSKFVGLKNIQQYEPARSKGKKRKCDIVLCFDVLEHIFVNDVPWLLNDLFSLAKKCVVINVACYPAAALLPNGENAHITLRHPFWWQGQIESVSSLYPKTYYALFTSPAYNSIKFMGLNRMQDKLDSIKYCQ